MAKVYMQFVAVVEGTPRHPQTREFLFDQPYPPIVLRVVPTSLLLIRTGQYAEAGNRWRYQEAADVVDLVPVNSCERDSGSANRLHSSYTE